MKNTLLIIFSLFLLFPCFAKDIEEYHIGHQGMTFVEFANELENKYHIKLFFDKSWVDSIQLKKAYSNESITKIVSDILAGTNLRFLKRDNIIILTNKESVSEEFSLQEKVKVTTKKIEYSQDEKDISSLQEQEYKIHEVGTALGKKKLNFWKGESL